jgi:hypothetical protein
LPEIPSQDLFAQQRASFMQNLRAQRDVKLSQCDWSQTVDIVAVKGPEWAAAWALYRQQLRDLPETYNQPALAVVVDMNQIQWPVCGAA